MQQNYFQQIFREGENRGDNRFLEEVTERYPYFAAAHFYLLKNTDRNDPSFAEKAAKAAIFFDAPYLPELMMQKYEKHEEVSAAIPTVPIEIAEETLPVEEIIITPATDVQEMVPDEETKNKFVAQAIEETAEAPLFEPLHATDYFASQGIKLSDDALHADKLGQQLKSFTAWLKTMKKVHPDRMGNSAVNENMIQHLAEKSNLEAEVVTEAMAEAYAQQGKTVQAIETWSKLSLQNPSKSAYFAAKIDSLKH